MNISENTFLRGAVVVISLAALSIALVLSRDKYEVEQELTEKLKNMSISRDSLEIENRELHDKNFECETTLGRYQLTTDYLREVNPKAAQQFENYLYTQTE
jgi:hypothetical protein